VYLELVEEKGFGRIDHCDIGRRPADEEADLCVFATGQYRKLALAPVAHAIATARQFCVCWESWLAGKFCSELQVFNEFKSYELHHLQRGDAGCVNDFKCGEAARDHPHQQRNAPQYPSSGHRRC